MAPVRVRRVWLLAPVAARVRRSLPVSLRISPTVMARTPRARAIPAAVDQFRKGASDAGLVLVSTYSPEVAAALRAVWIWAAVRAWGVWISHAAGRACRPRVCMAWLVMSVPGADV